MILKRKTPTTVTKTRMRMALIRVPTRKAATKTLMKKMAARTVRIRTQTTRMMTMTQMHLAKRRRKASKPLLTTYRLTSHRPFKMQCQSCAKLCLIWTAFRAQLTRSAWSSDRIKDPLLVILLLTNKGNNHHHEITIPPDKVLAKPDIDMKNLSTRQGAKAETPIINWKNSTPIRSLTLHLLFPAKTQVPFYPTLRPINKVFTKCHLNRCTSSTFLKPSNKSIYPIQTSEK